MKKIFLFAALTAAVLSSCSNDDDFVGSGANTGATNLQADQISFVTNNPAATRAGDVTSLTAFTATAITNDGKVYFDDMPFALSSGVFTSLDPYFWPSTGTLDFFAVNAGAIRTTNGVPSVNFLANDGSIDFVAATYKKASKMASVPLTFRHILSRLTVKVKPYDASDGYDYQVTGVRAYVKGSGVYKYDATTGGAGTWESKKDYKTYSFTTGLPGYVGKSYSGKVLAPTQVFYVIPATTSSDMVTFDLDYKVYKNGVLISDCTGDNCGTIDISEPDLAMGKSVCYILEPSYYEDGSNVIKFTSTVTPWGTTQEIDSDYAM